MEYKSKNCYEWVFVMVLMFLFFFLEFEVEILFKDDCMISEFFMEEVLFLKIE